MFATFQHPAAGAGAGAGAGADAGAAETPWFSRDDVLRQLAALGYTVWAAFLLFVFFCSSLPLPSPSPSSSITRSPPPYERQG